MRVAGHNVIAIALASIVFFMLGWLWFGMLFMEPWANGHGIPLDAGEGMSPAWMASGFLIAVLSAIGVSIAVRWGGLPDLVGAVKKALLLWVGFGLTAALYTYVYQPEHSSAVLMIDASYTLVGWSVMAVIVAAMK